MVTKEEFMAGIAKEIERRRKEKAERDEKEYRAYMAIRWNKKRKRDLRKD